MNDLERRIAELEARVGREQPNPYWSAPRTIWCVETGQKFESVKGAAKALDISCSQLSNAANRRGSSHTAGGYHWMFEAPKPQITAVAKVAELAQGLIPAIMKNELDDPTRQKLSEMAKLIAAALAVLLIACMPVRGSITYDVSIDTSKLPAGNGSTRLIADYQAALFLSDPAAPDNFSQAVLPVSFSIDGDIIRDDTHYYAAQPVLPVSPPIPLNFYLTLQGASNSPDYFLMAIRTPDGGMLAAPDGSEWLAWAAMDQDSPTLNLDLPAGVQMTSAVVPEPLPVVMMLAGMLLLRRRRAA